jgi:dihydrofolate reductase
MRDLIVTENITLDGVIDASGGWFSVANDAEVDQSDLVAALGEQSEAADAVLFGRVTFQEMRGFWPKQSDDTTGVTDYLNTVAEYVVSSTMGDPEWEHTTVLRGPGFQDEIRALKSKPGKDIVTLGVRRGPARGRRVLAGCGQRRALDGLPRGGTRQRGGVHQPPVVAPDRGVNGQVVQGQGDQVGGAAQPTVVGRGVGR